jgi:hypothetical protein
MKASPYPHIVRIDVDKPKKQHCWEVKIIRIKGMFHKSFSDTVCGGTKKALDAAIRCRDEELKIRPALNSYEQAIRPKKTNRSGIVGVRKGMKIVTRGKKRWEYPAWIVTGTPISGGKTKTKYFVISTIGSNKTAKEMAIDQRREWEEMLRLSVEAKLAAVHT